MYCYNGIVTRIVDGDTVHVDVDLGFNIWLRDEPLRLSGINARERKGATLSAANASKAFLEKIILNKRVTIRTEKDRKEKYGRWLATILFEEDKNLIEVNRMMVAEGHAVVYK